MAGELWPLADASRQPVFRDLLTLTASRGWHLLVNRRWSEDDAGRIRHGGPDAVVVGPPGVFVIAIGSEDEAEELKRTAQPVETAVMRSAVSSAVVQPLVVLASDVPDPVGAEVRCVVREKLVSLLAGQRQRAGFQPRMNAGLAEDIGRELPALKPHVLPEQVIVRPAVVPGQGSEGDGLFSSESVKAEGLEKAKLESIETWMTYLEPNQLPLVRRNWNGPARISGPAGTGKTVVGLHRAAYLAQRTSGRVLYVTYANNLPRVQQTFLRTMSPYVCERVDFFSLYKFVLNLLKERGVPHALDNAKAEGRFGLAWLRVRREHPELEAADPSNRYWKDEVEYVIKGRGITTLDGYRAAHRRGRGQMPRGVHKEMVWRLYEEYQRLLDEKGLHDLYDVLAMALKEVRTQPPGSPYASVIVDEAQDLPQLGVQMLHALVGDRPNGLLLIGDGQQSVYPGGFRLSEAGIDVRGDRGQVLRSNYRNAPQILEAALQIVSDVAFEDLDGTPGKGARDVELTCPEGPEGTVKRSAHPTERAHDEALIEALHRLAAPSDAALLCASRDAISHYRELLEEAGIPVCLLEKYDGRPVRAVKLGSYIRAKGLDFKHVFLPRHDERLAGDLDRNRLFVAMTRARDSLWLGSVRPPGDGSSVDGTPATKDSPRR